MRCGTPGESAQRDVDEPARVGELKRNSARIGVVQTNDDRAGAERRNQRVDAKLGDDHSIYDPDYGANHNDREHRQRYGQLIETRDPTSNRPQKLAT